MMLEYARKQPFRTPSNHLLFSRETSVIGPPTSAEVDLGDDDDVATTELEFFYNATSARWPKNYISG